MTTTVGTVVLDPATDRLDADPTRRLRRAIVVGAAVAAAPLFTLSNVLLPKLSGSNADVVRHVPPVADRLLAVELLYAVASLLYIALATVFVRPNVRRGAWLRFIGAVLTVVGAVGNAFGEVVQGYDAWGMHHAGVPQVFQVKLLDQLGSGPATLPISYAAIPVLAVGVLLLTVGLLRSRVVPTWAPWVAIVGGLASIPAGVGWPAMVGFVAAGATVVMVLAVDRSS